MPGNPISQEELDAAFFSLTSQPPANESVDATSPLASVPADAPASAPVPAQPLVSVPQFAPNVSFAAELESAMSSLTGQPAATAQAAPTMPAARGRVSGAPSPSSAPPAAAPQFEQYTAGQVAEHTPTIPSADSFAETGTAGYITQNAPGRPGSQQAVQGRINNIASSYERESAALDAAGMDAANQRNALAEEFSAMLQAERLQRDDEQVAEREMIDGIRREVEQLRALRIDPARLFRDRGAGVSMAVGIAVNAAQNTMLNILYPGSNPANTALQLVTSAVERDVAAQVNNINLARAGLGDQLNIADRTHALFEDRRATADYLRAKQLEQASMEMTASAARITSIQGREAALRAAEQLRLEADRSLQSAMASLAQRRVARGPRPTQQVPGYTDNLPVAPGFHISMSNPYVKARIDAFRAAHHGQDPSLSDLQGQFGLTSENLEQMRAFSEVEQTLRRVYAAVSDEALSLTTFTPATAAAKARLSAAMADYTTAYSKANGLGAMDDGVRAITLQVLAMPDGESWRGLALSDRDMIRRHISSLMNGVRGHAQRFASDSFGGAITFDPARYNAATALPSDAVDQGFEDGSSVDTVTSAAAPDAPRAYGMRERARDALIDAALSPMGFNGIVREMVGLNSSASTPPDNSEVDR